MFQLPAPLLPLALFPQFVLYRKADKMPVDPLTGANSNAQDPATWRDLQSACALESELYGVGFVFTKNDPFFFLDIDKCLEGAEWSPLALSLLGLFPGAAVEVSKSGRGLHIFGTGFCPPHSCKNVPLGIELYTEQRYCALTGLNAIGDVMTDHSPALASLVDNYFPATEMVTGEDWTTEHAPEWQGPSDDDELLRRAMGSRSASNAFNIKASFRDLWEANADVLGRYFPDQGGRAYDASSADAALAQHLAFWCGKNCERVRRLMERSGLVRDKWERADYLTRTVGRAVSVQLGVYSGRGDQVAPMPQADAPELSIEAPGVLRVGIQFMPVSQQQEFFKGFVYIQSAHRVFVPSGEILKPDQFKATYGGYLFAIDSANDKTSKNAWEVFTESQAFHFPKAFKTCFRPGEEPGKIIEQEGQTMVNVYVPCTVDSKQGDASRFYTHLAKILPDPRDQKTLLSYMAACVQHKGVKFQWCPLIQGVEGNGKTLFTRCVAQAVGKKYSHLPAASDIDNKFNAWLENKIFIGVEDIYIPSGRQEVLEALKPMITGEDQEKQSKGADQVMTEICANFILNSNHKDAVRKSSNDRRFAIFYTAQQGVADLARDGLTPDYFAGLYGWLKGGGYAIVTHELMSYKIEDEFNPATMCSRAPLTSSTSEAINLGAGLIEQELLEAVAEGRTGFAGGWVSMTHFTNMLHDLHIKVSMYKRCEILSQLGYISHPAFIGGRSPEPIPMDGLKKSRLFVHENSLLTQISSAPRAVADYVEAQAQNQTTEAQATFNQGIK